MDASFSILNKKFKIVDSCYNGINMKIPHHICCVAGNGEGYRLHFS
nr:hypothetical protein [Bacillus thuringiensis serovar israelensis]